MKERKFETTARERDWTAQRYNTGDSAAIFGPYMTLEESLMEVRNTGDVTDVQSIYKKVSKHLGESYPIAISGTATDQENGDRRD